MTKYPEAHSAWTAGMLALLPRPDPRPGCPASTAAMKYPPAFAGMAGLDCVNLAPRRHRLVAVKGLSQLAATRLGSATRAATTSRRGRHVPVCYTMTCENTWPAAAVAVASRPPAAPRQASGQHRQVADDGQLVAALNGQVRAAVDGRARQRRQRPALLPVAAGAARPLRWRTLRAWLAHRDRRQPANPAATVSGPGASASGADNPAIDGRNRRRGRSGHLGCRARRVDPDLWGASTTPEFSPWLLSGALGPNALSWP
jgi:hypothetical protein